MMNLPATVGEQVKELVRDSKSKNTLRCYSSALRRLDRWLDDHGMVATDESIAAYLGHLDSLGRAPSTASAAVAAAKFRGDPVGKVTDMALKGFRRNGRSQRGRGASDALSYDDVVAMQTVATQPRKRGRGMETPEQAAKRGVVDQALAGLLFMGGLRRSEAAALTWRDIQDADDGCLLVRVRSSKTNQDGSAMDVRLVKNCAASAIRSLRAARADDDDRVLGISAASINRRLQQLAKAAGIEGKRITAHSGRRGLASTLTEKGATCHEIMRCGNWRSARMVAHYAAGVSVLRGAVAKYL